MADEHTASAPATDVTIHDAELRAIYGTMMERWDAANRQLDERATTDQAGSQHYEELRHAHEACRDRLIHSILELDGQIPDMSPQERTELIAALRAGIDGESNGQAIGTGIRQGAHDALDVFRNGMHEIGEFVHNLTSGGSSTNNSQSSTSTEPHNGMNIDLGRILGGALGLGLAWLFTTLFGGGIVGMAAFGMLAIPMVIMGSQQIGPWVNNMFHLGGTNNQTQQTAPDQTARALAGGIAPAQVDGQLADIIMRPMVAENVTSAEAPTPWPGGVPPQGSGNGASVITYH